jgi:hypothetical protein
MLWILVLIVLALVLWKAIPVKIRSAELYDYMVEQARASQFTTSEALEKRILARAQQLGLPLDKDNIKAVQDGGRVRMTATYTVPLEFPGYTYQWNFRHEIDEPIFIF